MQSLSSVVLKQVGLPSLMAHLQAAFRDEVKEVNPDLDSFLTFCEDYLNRNRPVETFPVDNNYGIRLSNGHRLVISPGVVEIKGTMQETSAIQI